MLQLREPRHDPLIHESRWWQVAPATIGLDSPGQREGTRRAYTPVQDRRRFWTGVRNTVIGEQWRSLAVAWTDTQKREIVADYRRDGAALCPDCGVVLDAFHAGAYDERGHALLVCPRCKQWIMTSAVEGL